MVCEVRKETWVGDDGTGLHHVSNLSCCTKVEPINQERGRRVDRGSGAGNLEKGRILRSTTLSICNYRPGSDKSNTKTIMVSSSLDDLPVDKILEIVDAEMEDPKLPKVLLFDIGGVCVSAMLVV